MSPRTFVSRGAALLALAAFGMAACESKTVVQPNPFPLQVVVSPSTLNFTAAGQKAQLSASVTGGDAGQAAQGVNWASGNTAVATVDANGNVTAVANGTTTVIATSKAVTTVSGAAAVTVTITTTPPPPPPAKPTISIQSITTNAGANVDVTNAAGQINVALNVDVPAGNTINSVNTLIDGAIACSQTFTGSGSAGVSVEAANAVVIVCSIPTDKLDATGKPVFANGPHTLSATLVGPGGTVQASTSQSITFNNVSGLNLSATSTKTATDAAGLVWNGGDLTVTVTPTVFTAQTLQTISVSVAGSTKTATTTGNAPVSVTFKADSAVGGTTNGIAGVENAATTVTVSGVTTAGQPFNGNLGSLTLRLDNKAPVVATQPTFPVIQNGSSFWLNAATNFSQACPGSAGTFNCQLGAVVTDGGVDKVLALFQTAAAPLASSPTWVTDTSTAQIGEKATGSLVARVRYCDALNNCANSTVLPNANAFGVDITAPVIQTLSTVDTVSSNAVLSAASVDNLSGFNLVAGYTSVQITKDSAKTDGSDVKTCVNATSGAITSVPSSGACGFVLLPGNTQSFTLNDAWGNGYYTVVFKVSDLAGNTTTSTALVTLHDAVAPVISGVTASITTGAATAAVSGTVHDNVDLRQYNSREQFNGAFIPGVTSIPFTAPTTVKGWGLPLQGNASVSVTMPVIRGIQASINSGVLYQLNGLGFSAFDIAGNYAEGMATVATTPAVGVTATDIVIGNTTVTVNNADICASSDPATDCVAPVTTKTNTTPTFRLVMSNTTTANPLATVYFYRIDATGKAVYVSQTTSSTLSIPSSGANQNLRVFSYTGGTINAVGLPSGTNTVFAIGVDANGNGVLLGSATFTVQP